MFSYLNHHRHHHRRRHRQRHRRHWTVLRLHRPI